MLQFSTVEVPRGNTKPLPHEVEKRPQHDGALRRASGLQHLRGIRPFVVIGSEVVDVLVADANQPQLLEVGVVESPAAAKVEVAAVAQDATHGLLHLASRIALDLWLLHVLGAYARVITVEAQRFENGIGNLLLAQHLRRRFLDRGEQCRTRQEDLQEVVEVPRLQCGILSVVRKAQDLFRVGCQLLVLLVEVA
ncbi:hypothetical protein D9M68_752930 [compost metagenome]